MKQIGIFELIVILALQLESCKDETTAIPNETATRPIYADEITKSEGGFFSLLAEIGFPGEGKSGWDFYLSDGQSSLAFMRCQSAR